MLARRKNLAVSGILAAAATIAAAPSVAQAAPVIIPTSVADALAGSGQGLCIATAISTTPGIDFPQMAGVYNTGMNAFIEAHKADRLEYVVRTAFDLSNNYVAGVDTRSYGDFRDVMMPVCKTGGCDIFIKVKDPSDPTGMA